MELLANGPHASKEVPHDAKAAGISERTLRRAKSRLRVKVSKTGFQGTWCSALPGAEASKAAVKPKDGQGGPKGESGQLWEDGAGAEAGRAAR